MIRKPHKAMWVLVLSLLETPSWFILLQCTINEQIEITISHTHMRAHARTHTHTHTHTQQASTSHVYLTVGSTYFLLMVIIPPFRLGDVLQTD
jgi:hypothetical protein